MLIGIVVNAWEGNIELPEERGGEPDFDIAQAREDDANALFLFLATKEGTLKIQVETTGSDWDIYALQRGERKTLGYNGGNTDEGETQVRKGEFLMICINAYEVGGDATGKVKMWIE